MSEAKADPQQYIDYMRQVHPAHFPLEALAARRSYFGAASGPAVEVPPETGDRQVLKAHLDGLIENFWIPLGETIRSEMEHLNFTGHEDLKQHFDYLCSIWPAREAMQRAWAENDQELSGFLDHFSEMVVADLRHQTRHKQRYLAHLKQEMLTHLEKLQENPDNIVYDARLRRLPADAARRNRELLKELKQVIFKLRQNYPALVALDPEWIDTLESLKPRDLKYQSGRATFWFFFDCALVFTLIVMPMLLMLEAFLQ